MREFQLVCDRPIPCIVAFIDIVILSRYCAIIVPYIASIISTISFDYRQSGQDVGVEFINVPIVSKNRAIVDITVVSSKKWVEVDFFVTGVNKEERYSTFRCLPKVPVARSPSE